MSAPARRIAPVVFTRPMIASRRVDFPAPLAPMTPTIAPSSTESETSVSACALP